MTINLNPFIPPKHKLFEIDKQATFLHTVLWISCVTSFYFTTTNVGLTQKAFLLLSIISFVGIYLNKAEYYFVAALIQTFSTIFVLFYNFYDGVSLDDSGIVALPIIIIFSGFLFGRKMIIPITIINVAGVFLMVWFERTEIITPPRLITDDRIIIIQTLLIISGMFLDRILKNWEDSIIELTGSNRELEETYVQTLEGWAKALEFRDHETIGHIRRVTKICIQLAIELNISDPEVLENIERGALLHDIGKIAIPDKILYKPGPLTDEERNVVEEHPNHAYNLLKDIKYLQPALAIPYSHHERWDGTGYPQGLIGEEIPFPARIFSVVDNWDALTSDRPYRKAWTAEKTIEYIQNQSGFMFDPIVVVSFLALIEEYIT